MQPQLIKSGSALGNGADAQGASQGKTSTQGIVEGRSQVSTQRPQTNLSTALPRNAVKEQVVNKAPIPVEGIRNPAVAFIRSLAQPFKPIGCVLEMVPQFLDRLGRDFGKTRVRRPGQCLEQGIGIGGKQEMPHHGARKIAVGLLQQHAVPEGFCIAMKG